MLVAAAELAPHGTLLLSLVALISPQCTAHTALAYSGQALERCFPETLPILVLIRLQVTGATYNCLSCHTCSLCVQVCGNQAHELDVKWDQGGAALPSIKLGEMLPTLAVRAKDTNGKVGGRAVRHALLNQGRHALCCINRCGRQPPAHGLAACPRDNMRRAIS